MIDSVVHTDLPAFRSLRAIKSMQTHGQCCRDEMSAFQTLKQAKGHEPHIKTGFLALVSTKGLVGCRGSIVMCRRTSWPQC